MIGDGYGAVEAGAENCLAFFVQVFSVELFSKNPVIASVVIVDERKRVVRCKGRQIELKGDAAGDFHFIDAGIAATSVGSRSRTRLVPDAAFNERRDARRIATQRMTSEEPRRRFPVSPIETLPHY